MTHPQLKFWKSTVLTGIILSCLAGWIFTRQGQQGNPGPEDTVNPGKNDFLAQPDIGYPATVTPLSQPGRKAIAAPAANHQKSWQAQYGVSRIIATKALPPAGGFERRVHIVESRNHSDLLRVEEWWKAGGGPDSAEPDLIKASVATHVLVRPTDDTALEKLRSILDENAFILETEPYLKPWYRLKGFNAEDPQALPSAIALLADRGEWVQAIEPDWIVSLSSDQFPNEASLNDGELWGLHNIGRWNSEKRDADIDAPAAWSILNDAAPVIVAVCDTGINADHEDLAANLWVNAGEIPGDGLDNDGNGVIDDINGFDVLQNGGAMTDTQGHGSHVAGIIGAVGNNGMGVTGVAWNVQLMGCRWIGDGLFGSTSDAVKSIRYAIANGADVINASWGGFDHSQALEDALRDAGAADVLVVASAGNDALNTEVTPSYPGSSNFSNIITVGASNPMDGLAWFTNYGRGSVDLAAPGVAIKSTYIGSSNAYTEMSGTSMAAPFVSGTAALLRTQFPELSSEGVINILRGTIDSQTDLDETTLSGGRLNAGKALQAIVTSPQNDDWTSAYALNVHSSRWRGSNIDANQEPALDGELLHSIWFRFTCNGDALMFLSGSAAKNDTRWTVYKGWPTTQNSRLLEVEGDGFSEYIPGSAGDSFYLRVASPGDPTKDIIIDWLQLPENDDLESAAYLSGTVIDVEQSNRGASAQVGEPVHAGVQAGHSVWWQWEAPKTGLFTLTTKGSEFDTVLAVYSGNGQLSGLVNLTSNDDENPTVTSSRVSFLANASETYYIVVDSYDYGDAITRPSGPFRLSGQYEDGLYILSQPRDVYASLGDSAQFSFTYSGMGDTQIQWYHDGVSIPGATQQTLTIPTVRPEDLGGYWARISAGSQLLETRVAQLKILEAPPEIVWQTRDATVLNGSPATLAIRATGSEPLIYQWFKNGAPLAGKTEAELRFTSVQAGDTGSYSCTVSNDFGSRTSAVIPLRTVEQPWQNWTERHSGESYTNLLSIDFVNNEFLASTDDSRHYATVIRSSDGKSWSVNERTSERPWYEPFSKIVSDGTYYMAMGDRILLGGYDPLNMQPITVPFSNNWIGNLAYGNGIWVITGEGGPAWSDDQGQSWNKVENDQLSQFTRLRFVDGAFYGLQNSYFFKSTDGINWIQTYTPDNYDRLWEIVSFKGELVILNSFGGVFRSADGTHWTEIPLGLSSALRLVAGDDYCFVLSNNTVWFSDDLVNWFASPIPTEFPIQDIAWGDGRLVAVGDGEHVFEAGTDSNLSPQVSFVFPSTNASVPAGSTIKLQVEALDPDGTIASVEFYRNGIWIGSDTSPPYELPYSPDSSNLEESISVIAIDDSGREARDAIVLTPTLGAVELLAPFTDVNTWGDMIVHEGFFYAVTRDRIMKSADGISWDSLSSPIRLADYRSLTAHHGLLIASSEEGLAVSKDGITWLGMASTDSPIVPEGLHSGDKWVVGQEGYHGVAFSKDGMQWKSVELDTFLGLRSVMTGGDTILAYYSNSVDARLFSSQNGEDWTEIALAEGRLITDMIFEEDRFVMLVSNGGGVSASATQVWQSGNGLDWTKVDLDKACTGLTYANGLYFAGSYVLSSTAGSRLEYISDDGLTWQAVPDGVKPDILSVAWNGSRFVAVGDRSQLYWSPDGLAWNVSEQLIDRTSHENQVASNGSVFTTLPFGGSTAYSFDGIDWNISSDLSFGTITDVALFKGEFFVGTSTGVVAATTDGINWRIRQTTGGWIVGLAVNGDVLVAGGIRGFLEYTTDGANWTRVAETLIANEDLNDLTFTGEFFVGGVANRAVYSANGIDWSTSPRFGQYDLTRISGRPGTILGILNNGDFVRSINTEVWEAIPNPGISGISSLETFGNQFVISTSAGKVWYSEDGYTWSATTATDSVVIIDLVATDYFLFALDGEGSIYKSSNVLDWTRIASHSFAFRLMTDGQDAFIAGVPGLTAVSEKDLLVSSATLGTANAKAGDRLEVFATLHNSGNQTVQLGGMKIRCAASRNDQPGDGDDVLLGLATLPAMDIAPGSSPDISFEVFVPQELQEGSHYLVVELDPDNRLWERNKLNNLFISDEPAFSLSAWNLNVQTDGVGTVQQSAYAIRYTDGSRVFLVPATGKRQSFTGWSGSGQSLAGLNDVTATINGETSVTAHFAAGDILNIQVTGGGTVSTVPGGYLFPRDSTVAVLAEPAMGWRFSHWEGISGNADLPISSHAMQGDASISAVFVQSYEDWADAHFLSPSQVPTGRTQDADKDQFSNELERMLGMDPNVPDVALFRMYRAPDDQLKILYKFNSAMEQSATWETSTDLENWTPVTLPGKILSTEDGIEVREVALPDGDKRFYRLVSD
jgi:subtilisin family serine protease